MMEIHCLFWIKSLSTRHSIQNILPYKRYCYNKSNTHILTWHKRRRQFLIKFQFSRKLFSVPSSEIITESKHGQTFLQVLIFFYFTKCEESKIWLYTTILRYRISPHTYIWCPTKNSWYLQHLIIEKFVLCLRVNIPFRNLNLIRKINPRVISTPPPPPPPLPLLIKFLIR